MRWFVEDVGIALTDPRSLIAIARVEKRGLGEALAFVILFSLATILSLSAPVISLLSTFLPIEVSASAYILAAAIGVSGGLVLWILDSALMHFISRALGGQGALSETATAVGYSYAAMWPIALAGLASCFTSWLPSLFLIALGLVLEVAWRWYVLVNGLSEVHGYSTLRGLLTIILARLVYVALFVAIPLLAASAAAPGW